MATPPTPGGGGVAGSGGSGGSGGAAGSGGEAGAAGSVCGDLTFGSATCQACMDSGCCNQNGACSKSTDCLAVIRCIQLCPQGDTVCTNTCLTLPGTALYSDLALCMDGACSTQCAGSAADAGASCGNLSFNRPTCPACINSYCCQLAGQCYASSDCVTIQMCAQVCPLTDAQTDDYCVLRCLDIVPTGQQAFRNLDGCMRTYCSATCP